MELLLYIGAVALIVLLALFVVAGVSMVFLVAYAIIRKARKARYPIQMVKKWKPAQVR
jgi:uncharacterized membrane-anchored protein